MRFFFTKFEVIILIKTWDIFDTLVARRCIFPHAIFQIIEQQSKLQNFAKARITAEKNAAQRLENYNLDDIYIELQKISNLNDDAINNLKNLECEVEINQAIPITENLLQVKAGDILISDMYLPEKVIQQMLDKVGLIEPVEIVITTKGKSTGKIWNQFTEQKQFVFHIGNNLTSDVENPRKAGHESSISILSNRSPFLILVS